MDGKSAYGLAQRGRDHGGDGTQASPAPQRVEVDLVFHAGLDPGHGSRIFGPMVGGFSCRTPRT
jgi:hypothetical protein